MCNTKYVMKKDIYVCTSDNHQVQLLESSVEGAREYFQRLHGEDCEAVNYTELLANLK